MLTLESFVTGIRDRKTGHTGNKADQEAAISVNLQEIRLFKTGEYAAYRCIQGSWCLL